MAFTLLLSHVWNLKLYLKTTYFDNGKIAILGVMKGCVRHGIGKEYILFQMAQDFFHEVELNYHYAP